MKLATALLSLALAGCAGLPTIDEERQQVSSGFTGCAPTENKISDNAQYTWAAQCKAKMYRCTVTPQAACAAVP